MACNLGSAPKLGLVSFERLGFAAQVAGEIRRAGPRRQAGTGLGSIRLAGCSDRLAHRGFLSVLVAQVNGWW
jgi:hypothetical protein